MHGAFVRSSDRDLAVRHRQHVADRSAGGDSSGRRWRDRPRGITGHEYSQMSPVLPPTLLTLGTGEGATEPAGGSGCGGLGI